MATLTATGWTVRMLHATGVAQNANARQVDMDIVGKHKYVQAIMTLATGESPLAGVPWPDKGAFGFYRNLDSIILHNSYPWSTATVAPTTVSGKHVLAQSIASAGRIRFLAEHLVPAASGSGAASRAIKQLATNITLSGGGKLYVTCIGW
jgi:hypothetical protein